MVPFSFDGTGGAAAEGGAGYAGGGGAGVGRGGAGTAAGTAGEFIIIVPLNLGAATPFIWKLHLLQLWAVSGF
jgi:hypothetical protein